MSIDPLTISGKVEDKIILQNLEQWKEIINVLVTAYNAGATKNLNTSASYDVVVDKGTITGVS